MTKPVFVIGRDRSGTKWLSNILANNKEIACVQHKDHSGILEASDILVSMPILFGSISIPENFIAFLECVSQTDYFRVTGLTKDYFYKLRPMDYFSFFKEVMERFAEKEGKRYWVQKSGVISLDDLYKHFTDVNFIIIVRNLKDNIRSKIGQRKLYQVGDQKKHLLKEVVKYIMDMEHIRTFSNKRNVYTVQYEDLRTNKISAVKNICKFLQIEFDEAMLIDNFRKNTSFRRGISKDEILTKSDEIILDVLALLFNSLPGWIYKYLYPRRKQNLIKVLCNPQEKKFISFKLRKKELGWEEN